MLWGHKLIIPKIFQVDLLKESHVTHMNTIKIKSEVRSTYDG